MFSIVNFKVYIANKILKWQKNVENICMHIHQTLRPHLVESWVIVQLLHC